MSKKVIATLKNATLNHNCDTGARWATGEVFNHPKFQDGERIHTSQIINDRTLKNGERRITTKNTIYILPNLTR